MRLVPILHGPVPSVDKLPCNLTEAHIGHAWQVDWAWYIWTGSTWFKALVTESDASA